MTEAAFVEGPLLRDNTTMSAGALEGTSVHLLTPTANSGHGDVSRRLRSAMASHRARVLNALRRSGLDAAEAEDVAQEAYAVLAHRFEHVPEPAQRAFLVNTALRMAADRRRTAWHRVMRQSEDPTVELAVTLAPEELSIQRERQRYFDAALSALPDAERRVFLLVEVEALSRQEAAHLLGLPAGTIASRLARARTRLENADDDVLRRAAQTLAERDGEQSLALGSYRYLTNGWGLDKSGGLSEQQLIQRTKNKATQTGWYWYWSGLDRSVFAYPEVMTGWKPWNGGTSTDSRLPVHLSKSKGLVVDYAADVRATGSYNLAISTWLSARDWSLSPDPAAITTEVMVWPDYTAGATPQGALWGAFTVAGEAYEVWWAVGYGKRYRSDGQGWTVLTLRGVGGRHAGSVPLGELLDRLVAAGLVASDQFVTCVELGNEVMGGAGTTFVEAFGFEL